jgi:cytochrome P450
LLGASVTVEQLELDPHPVLAQLRAEEPVAWIRALNAWLVTRRDLALLAMRDAETFTVDDPRFSTAQVVGQSMLSLDGAEHAHHRDPFARAYRLDEVRRRFSELVASETDRLIDGIEADGEAELRRALAGPLAVAVVAEALGLESAESTTVLGWYDAIVDSVTGVNAGRPATSAGHAAFAELSEAVGPALAELEGPLTREELVSNAAVIMFGGIETTEGAIANLVLHVLSHPEQLALVRSDRKLLANAVEESLRLEPSVVVVDRFATRDVQLGGASIGRGDMVSISIAGANRDPAFFADPDRFDVTRENARHHITFAHGPHVCLGMHLARLEAQTALARMLERLPRLRLDPARPAAPRGLVFRKPPELHVLWDAR